MSGRPLLALVVLALFASARPAHARFGKRSKDNSEAARSSPSQGSTHTATPVVGDPTPAQTTAAAAPVYAGPRWSNRHRHHRGWFGGGYIPYYVVPAPAAQVQTSEEPQARAVRVSASAEAMAFGSGASAGLGLAFEGERAGFTAGFHTILVAADDGSGGLDTIKQLNGRITWALLAGSHGRLRVEAGVDSAFAPELIVVGPSLGASGVLWVAGPFALEGSVSVTPFPFRQVDTRAGLGLGLGPVGLRAGWRALMLDDAGLLDGVAHQDFFSGPYVGVSLVF
ncbi:MAG: hypothetical protein ACYC8T_31205 [Myxococcaceae bacterium]